MARKQSGDLHKVTVVQMGHTLIRVCVNCGGSWQLVTLGDLQHPKLAWKPIAEVDENDREVRFAVEITECEHVEDGSADTKPVRTVSGLAAVDKVASRSTRGKVLCYCKECNGKDEHFPDAKNCYCRSCAGKRTHYVA